MKDFEKQLIDDILIEKVNLIRATLLEAGVMKKRLFENIQLNNKNIIVDVSKCTFIDSTFLGALIVSLKRAQVAGGDIKIVITSSSTTEGILNITGFLRVFENYTSVEDAIKSFRVYSREF
jgi:anti-anti-sigma factor